MTVVNYVPLSAALADIFTILDAVSDDPSDIEEYASMAVQKISVRQTYQENIAILKVTDHKACLPKGVKYIEQMFCLVDETNSMADIIKLVHGTETADYDKFTTFENASSYFNTHWMPIRAATSLFSRAVHCENSINLYQRCEQEYSVGKAGDITTSFQTGYLSVGYLSYPMTADGEFLIPDDPEVTEAIKDYVFSRVWERRMNYGVDGAERMWMIYLRQFEMRAAKVRGKLLLPSLDEWQNLQDQLLRIGKHSSYFTGFGTLAEPENLLFTHRYN